MKHPTPYSYDISGGDPMVVLLQVPRRAELADGGD